VSFLLDTNVVSEWVRLQPDRNVISWPTEVEPHPKCRQHNREYTLRRHQVLRS